MPRPFRFRIPFALGLRDHRELVIVAATAVLVFLTVWSQSRVDRLELSLAEEGQEQRRLRSQIEFLARDMKRSTSLAEVEARARRELELVTPEPEQVLILNIPPAERDGEVPGLEFLVPDAYAGPRQPERAR